jgi:predicted ribosomally synthesized peptide with nif11-like leader
MPQEAIKRLIAALEADAGLKTKVLSARSAEEAARIAVEAGYDVTVEELIGFAGSGGASSDTEMTDAELAGASGGIGLPMMIDLKGIGIRLTPSLPGLDRTFAAECGLTKCEGLSNYGCKPGGTDG